MYVLFYYDSIKNNELIFSVLGNKYLLKHLFKTKHSYFKEFINVKVFI